MRLERSQKPTNLRRGRSLRRWRIANLTASYGFPEARGLLVPRSPPGRTRDGGTELLRARANYHPPPVRPATPQRARTGGSASRGCTEYPVLTEACICANEGYYWLAGEHRHLPVNARSLEKGGSHCEPESSNRPGSGRYPDHSLAGRCPAHLVSSWAVLATSFAVFTCTERHYTDCHESVANSSQPNSPRRPSPSSTRHGLADTPRALSNWC